MTNPLTRLHIAHQAQQYDDERGAALAEYGLLLALVALGAMAIMVTFGETIANTFGFANETLTNSPAVATS